nr:PH domain-containing protein [Actinomycetota bacterium]
MTVEAGTVPAVGTPDAGWARLSPLTPLLRSGRFLLVVIAVLTQQGLRQPDPRLLLGALAVALPVTLLLGWLSWRATRYRVTDAELQVDSGVLQRRNRRVPLARLQSVDVVRPLLARALGLAELRLEVVGGGSTEAPLAYLPEADAQRLRLQLLALAAGERAEASAPDAAEPPEQLLVQVPTQALVVSVLLGAPVVVLGVLVLAVVGLLLVEPQLVPGLVVGLVPLVLGTGGMVVRRLLAEYGFTVAESADGLRLRHGLLETRAQTIPPGRVQTVRITEPLLWRRRGWVRVEVDVAGYA